MEKAVMKQPSIFVLCDACRWCATYLDKSRARDRCCPACASPSSTMSSFPVMQDESFTFSYDDKRGIEMDFGRRAGRR